MPVSYRSAITVPSPMNTVRFPERSASPTPAKLSADATTAATAVASAGAINHRARPANVPTSSPAPSTTVAHPNANVPRLPLSAISHTSAPTTVAAPIVRSPSADRGRGGRSRRCLVHDSHRSLVEPPSVLVDVSVCSGAGATSTTVRPRHSATAPPRSAIATTQPASGSLASPLNSHRADSRTAIAPPMRRIVPTGGDVGESASKARQAT